MAGYTDGVTVQCACPGKLNLSLSVTGRRADGYHLIESEIVPIAICDRLRVRVSPGAARVEFDVTGREVPVGASNLASRAAELYLRRTGWATRVELSLVKRIPVGAGLGGGSSDAAAVLRSLDELHGSEVGMTTLLEWGVELGADVPFFVFCAPAIASGIGDRLQALDRWPTDPLVVAQRGSGLATAAVYAQFDATLTSPQEDSSIPAFPPPPLLSTRNDLEAAACLLEPEIDKLKHEILLHGAYDVRMSGSGSAVFGFFGDEGAAGRCAESIMQSGGWAESTRILNGPLPIERLDERLS